MAPNAAQVRQRRYPATVEKNDNNKSIVNHDNTTERSSSATTTNEPKLIANVTNLQPNEITIDGIIYNLDTFNHPGGDAIKVFGGNDVSIQYRMIHPYHTSKHLEKLQSVGRIVNYTSE